MATPLKTGPALLLLSLTLLPHAAYSQEDINKKLKEQPKFQHIEGSAVDSGDSPGAGGAVVGSSGKPQQSRICKAGETPEVDHCMGDCKPTPGYLEGNPIGTVKPIMMKLLKHAGYTNDVAMAYDPRKLTSEQSEKGVAAGTPFRVVTPHTYANPGDHPGLVISGWAPMFVRNQNELIFALAHESIHILKQHTETSDAFEREFYDKWTTRIKGDASMKDFADTVWMSYNDLVKPPEGQRNRAFACYAEYKKSPEDKELLEREKDLWRGQENQADLEGCQLAYDVYGDAKLKPEFNPLSGMCVMARFDHFPDDPIHGSIAERQEFIAKCVMHIMDDMMKATISGLSGPTPEQPKDPSIIRAAPF
jgi:hypothetical protein